MHTFKKLDRRFPLTQFQAFLAQRIKFPAPYVASMRSLLAALERRLGTLAGLDWQNLSEEARDEVRQHLRALPSERQKDFLQAVWVHWQVYAGFTGERLGEAVQTNRAPLAEALRRLREARRETKEMLDFNWYKIDGIWRVVNPDTNEKAWLEAKWQPALRVVREWGFPGPTPGADGCFDGALFLPFRPHADFAMVPQVLYRLLSNRRDPATAERLDREMAAAALEASRALRAQRAITPVPQDR